MPPMSLIHLAIYHLPSLHPFPKIKTDSEETESTSSGFDSEGGDSLVDQLWQRLKVIISSVPTYFLVYYFSLFELHMLIQIYINSYRLQLLVLVLTTYVVSYGTLFSPHINIKSI